MAGSVGGGTGRDPDIDYLAQVARAAEQAGFEAVLTPAGLVCEDAWLVTAALTRETTRLKFLVAFRVPVPDAGRADGRDVPAVLTRTRRPVQPPDRPSTWVDNGVAST